MCWCGIDEVHFDYFLWDAPEEQIERQKKVLEWIRPLAENAHVSMERVMLSYMVYLDEAEMKVNQLEMELIIKEEEIKKLSDCAKCELHAKEKERKAEESKKWTVSYLRDRGWGYKAICDYVGIDIKEAKKIIRKRNQQRSREFNARLRTEGVIK